MNMNKRDNIKSTYPAGNIAILMIGDAAHMPVAIMK